MESEDALNDAPLWYISAPGTAGVGYTGCNDDVLKSTGTVGSTGCNDDALKRIGCIGSTGYTESTVCARTLGCYSNTVNLSYSLPVRQVSTVAIGNVSSDSSATSESSVTSESIVINATKETLAPVSGSLRVAPIRIVTTLTDGCLPLYYDADTCEIVAHDDQSETQVERRETQLERSEMTNDSETVERSEARGTKRSRIQDEYAQDMGGVERSSSSCRLV